MIYPSVVAACYSLALGSMRVDLTHHTAKIASHEEVVERGQLQVGGAQVPGELEALAVGDAAAPVGRTQGTRAWRALI